MKYIFAYIFSIAVLASCTHAEQEDQEVGERQLSSVYVSYERPKFAPGVVLTNEDSDDAIIDDAIIIDEFEEGDLLYFSQLSSSSSPNFTDKDNKERPLYVYKYNEKKDAVWSEGFNFECVDNSWIFDWNTVANIGSVGNAFSLFAFYFPKSGETIKNNVEGDFHVMDDQRGGKNYDKSNFMKSDIMGAYHATSSLYTRLRFRLFHLMVYLKVTIYVPVYDESKYEEPENKDSYSYSGFKKDALQDPYVMNAYTDFKIEWQAKRSSDTEAPLTQSTGTKTDIKMYRHYADQEIIEDFKVKDYYTGDNLGTDKVRAYTFSVLFPSQQFNDNFLCFPILSPDNTTKKYYYFSSSQIMGSADKFGLTQGTLQELYLYLPRTTNQTVLVGANILPWSNSVTDMTVTKEPKNTTE